MMITYIELANPLAHDEAQDLKKELEEIFADYYDKPSIRVWGSKHDVRYNVIIEGNINPFEACYRVCQNGRTIIDLSIHKDRKPGLYISPSV